MRRLRRFYLTEQILQFRYLGSIMLAVLIPTLFVGGCLYYLIFTILAENIAIPDMIAYTLLPVVRTVNILIITTLPILIVLLLIWGIFISHRLAGPIKRLEKELERIIEEKDFSCRIYLRKKDDLKKVADNVNRLLEQMQLKS